ncbi:D-methionine transport system substrate-binding protein [Treponema bryantii]|uniref:D-methionine transport system substrate-binding protein n=1 Tax=Treponema bryantii TaxID=163 RepID=A0A1H9JUQ2_9SPIR|nr:MetQ/NlpA family ABC transporter substrate-binding protein [Treponema bryantii]BDC92870.1 ABC transporter substrate-binding protein [Treponema bryantii]SEQ90646.1 D-methionine transport system substrate-binding protein [Treponema bryantii]
MKKIIAFTAAVFAAASLFAASIKVGATPEPHADLLNLIKDDLKAEGVDLKIIEFTDYVTPNEAVESGEIDANYFQHIPYLESFNSERGYHLVNAGGIHVEPIALYSKKVKNIKDLKKKARIAIPNDPTNEGRALLLLADAGLITLDPKAGITATVQDITSNPLKLKFTEVEAASLPRVLADVDAAVINGNYAIPAGLSAKKDGLYVEGSSSPYVNVIAVKAGNENKPEIQALVKALKSEKVRKFIEEKYPNGEVVVVF